jgi:hypothetical protein
MRIRLLSRRSNVVIVGAGALAVVGTVLAALSISLSAQTAPSGADLAQQYLAAMGPASSAISIAEGKLEKLPVTASVAQVRAIVAPLGPALAKLEALNSATTSSSPTSGPGLESLGRPSIVGSAHGTCNGYSTPAAGATLQVGYTKYTRGFQLTAPGDCTDQRWANYSWNVSGKYSVLSAYIGLSYSNGYSCGTVRFLGNNGSPLRASTRNGLVGSVAIPTSGVTHVTVNFSGNSVLTIQVGYPCNGGSDSVIDVVNDQLS